MLLGLYVLKLPIFSTGGHAGFPVCGGVSEQVRPACGAVRCWSTDRSGAVEHSCTPVLLRRWGHHQESADGFQILTYFPCF